MMMVNTTSNIEWCEALVMRETGGGFGSALVREPVNTVSNAAFFAFAILGVVRIANQTQLPRALLATEATLLVVGTGSTIFHATASVSVPQIARSRIVAYSHRIVAYSRV